MKESKKVIKILTGINGIKVKIQFVNTSCFSNGDSILETKTEDEWCEATKNKQPAYFIIKNHSNFKSLKLYNWYAVSDGRVISSNGLQIPTIETFTIIENLIFKNIEKKQNIFKMINQFINRKHLLEIKPTSYIETNGKLFDCQMHLRLWSHSEYDKKNAYCFVFDFFEKKVKYLPYSKEYGYALIEIEK